MIYSLKYVDSLPVGVGGQARLWFITILKKYQDDTGILVHEIYHVKCWWKYGVIGRLLYRYNKKWRLNEEVNAYKEQLKHSPQYLDFYAQRMTEMYNLGVTKEEIIEKLK
jgi:hypothetical protein